MSLVNRSVWNEKLVCVSNSIMRLVVPTKACLFDTRSNLLCTSVGILAADVVLMTSALRRSKCASGTARTEQSVEDHLMPRYAHQIDAHMVEDTWRGVHQALTYRL